MSRHLRSPPRALAAQRGTAAPLRGAQRVSPAGHRAPSSSASGDAATPPFRRSRVVSSFLCHGSPGTPDFRVSVFKRSAAVHAYGGRWAACSGRIEPSDASPVHAALRELREETGLPASMLERIGGGGGPRDAAAGPGLCFELRDVALRTVWEIWPFLWRVRGATGATLAPAEVAALICLGAEHDDMRFVGLDEMAAMDTVENLGRGVRVVLAALDTA